MEKSSMNIPLFQAKQKSIKVYNNIMVKKIIIVIFIQEIILGSQSCIKVVLHLLGEFFELVMLVVI